MKISPPLAVIAIVVVAMSALVLTKERSRDQSSDPRCEVLESYILTVIDDEYKRGEGNPIALSTAPEDPGLFEKDNVAGYPELAARLRTHPLSELYTQLAASKTESPTGQCPALTRLPDRKGLKGKIILDKREGPPPLNKEGAYDLTFLRVSMPAISADGQEAVLFSGLVYAPLAGGGSEVYLRRDKNGRWVPLYQAGTWIS